MSEEKNLRDLIGSPLKKQDSASLIIQNIKKLESSKMQIHKQEISVENNIGKKEVDVKISTDRQENPEKSKSKETMVKPISIRESEKGRHEIKHSPI